MEIKISNNKKIITDKYQFIYCEKRNEVWVRKWFYPSLAHCYNDLLEEFTRTEDRKSLEENMGKAVELLKSVKIAIK